MTSSHKVRALVRLYDQRRERTLAEIARIERKREQSRVAEQQLDAQIDSVQALLNEQLARRGVMDRAALYEARRHMAVLLSRRLDLRQSRIEAEREVERLQTACDAERGRLLGVEKKRGNYQEWLQGQRRARLAHRALLEQSEIEERTSWCKR